MLMTGLDHKKADLATREQFAVNSEAAEQALDTIIEHPAVNACVLVSTCNRTELYASVTDPDAVDLTDLLCRALGRSVTTFADYFSTRRADEALGHLCRVASGVDSQIMGDDQIITQVRQALELSRARGYTDSYLERFFNAAIQAAKSIKTNVILKSVGFDSVPGKTVEHLGSLLELDQTRALVIGNGQIGKLVSALLLAAGASVTVTLRENKMGTIEVVEGVSTVGYNSRYAAIGQCDLVVSATTSPHYTLTRAELANLTGRPKILVDLALPRDIEPEVAELPDLLLLTLDDISSGIRNLSESSLASIESIVARHVERYNNWLQYKNKTENREGSVMKLFAVGLGPGDNDYLAPRARLAIEESDVIVGYTGYMTLIADLIADKQQIATGMTSEAERCEAAIATALAGHKVCVVCSGDAGIYGMAGLLYELAEPHPELDIEVIPGITAAVSTAAVLGSPLTNDFAVISLSDLLTPWSVIEQRLDAVSAADMVVCLYNPQSSRRHDYIQRAADIALQHKSPDTPCGYVRNAYRGNDGTVGICQLAELSEAPIDMFTTVIIGNSATRVINGKLVTARGYRL